MRSLSRLKALQAFEAAARHGSFVGAAKEMNVTAAAVGQLVRTLEAWLKAPLFARKGAGSERLVVLDDAREALGNLSAGLDLLEEALQKLRSRNQKYIVTATASQAIVAKWLLPNLNDFASRHPDIVLRLDVTDRPVDLVHGEADIGIRCGSGTWKDLQATYLHHEEVIAVCAPSLLPLASEIDLDWLKAQMLLHDTTPASVDVFPSWATWAERFGEDPSQFHSGTRMNASTAIIQAAAGGHGVALARRQLVVHDLSEGRLVHIFRDRSLPIPWAYFSVASPQALKRQPVAAFQDWLLETWRSAL